MGMFSGKSGSQSKSSGSKSSKSSIQKQINAEQARIGKGNWNQKLNDLVKQRDNAGSGSSGGIRSIGTALKNAPKNIARDIGMGVGLKDRDADYYRRTANTIARTQGKAAADRYISQMTNKGGLAAAGVKSADVSGSVNYGQRIGMLNRDGSVNTRYGRGDRGGSNVVTPAPEDVQSPAEQTQVNQAMLNRMRMMQGQDSRARNMDMARMMFERQNMRSPGPMPRQMQGIGGFRRQPPPGMYERMMRQGPRQYGGQGVMRPAVMPRMPQPMPRNQASSPAFRYAAQNYDRLGGMQRTMPRPMEMMSRAERQQIGRIADSFQPQPMQNPYVGILQRGISAKGGGRTMPQRGQFNSMQELMDFQNQNPSMNLMGEYQRLKALEGGGRTMPQRPPMSGKGGGRTMPQRGGGMPRPPLPFAFGRF